MSIDEQNILMGDLVPAWESGIQQMADKVAGEGGFIPVCEDAFNDITDATKAYKDELDDMAQTAGFDLTDVKNGVDDLAYSFEDLITDNEELTSRMYDELDAVQLLRAEAHALVEEYKAVIMLLNLRYLVFIALFKRNKKLLQRRLLQVVVIAVVEIVVQVALVQDQVAVGILVQVVLVEDQTEGEVLVQMALIQDQVVVEVVLVEDLNKLPLQQLQLQPQRQQENVLEDVLVQVQKL